MANSRVLYAVVAAGLALAAWHGYFAWRAIAMFDDQEPLTSWLAVTLGPALTLAGAIVAVSRPVAGGATVLAAGVLSAAAFLAGERGWTDYVPPYLLKFTLPVLAVGCALIVVGRIRTEGRKE